MKGDLKREIMTEIKSDDGKYVLCVDIARNNVTTEFFKIESYQDYHNGQYEKKETRRPIFKTINTY